MTPRRRGGPTRGEAVRPPARTRSANPDRELVAAVRAELAAIEPTRARCRAAERIGLGSAATGEGALRGGLRARLAVRLGPSPAASAPGASPSFDWAGAADHCRMAWLRGTFLAHGSLSLGFARTHLEFVVAPADAPELAGRLASLGLPAAVRLRRGRAVLTWKSGERVAAFLRGIGAGPSLLELEARGVARTLRGELNRLLNAEAANLERSVGASARQLEAIGRLEAEGRLAGEREAVRAVAQARLRGPDATLGELADELGVTRSSVQRALERIERLALQLPDGDPSRRTGERGAVPTAGGIGEHLRLDAGNAPFGPVREGLVPG